PRLRGLIVLKRVSQNRRTCCGRSSSSAASEMVRNASGDLSKPQVSPARAGLLYLDGNALRNVQQGRKGKPSKALLSSSNHRLVDLRLQHVGRFEHKNLAWQDRHFLAGLGIAANSLVFRAHLERSEGGKLDVGA